MNLRKFLKLIDAFDLGNYSEENQIYKKLCRFVVSADVEAKPCLGARIKPFLTKLWCIYVIIMNREEPVILLIPRV